MKLSISSLIRFYFSISSTTSVNECPKRMECLNLLFMDLIQCLSSSFIFKFLVFLKQLAKRTSIDKWGSSSWELLSRKDIQIHLYLNWELHICARYIVWGAEPVNFPTYFHGLLDFLYGQLAFLYGQLNTFYMVKFRIVNGVHNALRPKSNKDGCQQARRAANLLSVCHCELAEQGHSKCGSVDRDEQLFNELYFVFKFGVDCSRACATIPKLQHTWSNE